MDMTQIVLPGVFFMGISGVVMAAHYSLHRFIYPAFTSVLFNLAIIFSAILLAGLLGVKSLALGLVVGAFAMVAFQAAGLARHTRAPESRHTPPRCAQDTAPVCARRP